MKSLGVFDSVQETVRALRRGDIIILVDSHDRENEGDFVVSAQKADEKKLAFMISHGRGILCVPVTEKKAFALGLNRVAFSSDRFGTPFTVSVDAKTAGSGVSVKDRLAAIRLLSFAKSKPSDFARPGHVFPLAAKPFGVLQRPGHTEGAVDLMRLARLGETAAIIEIMKEDGSMARLKDLLKIKKRFGLKMVSVKQIADFRLSKENILEKVAAPNVPTLFGFFKVVGFKDKVFGKEFIAVVSGSVKGKQNVLVRVHSACFTGDVLFSKKCDCRDQLSSSMELIQKEGGAIVYSPDQEGRGIGLLNKLRAYKLQEKGLDTVQANTALGFETDQRDYAMSAQVIRALGIRSVRLLSNNPKKALELERFGVKVLGIISLKAKPNRFNKGYLKTKKIKMAHLL